MMWSVVYLFILIFLCNEYQVLSDKEYGDSKLYLHIPIDKGRPYELRHRVVKEGNISIQIKANYYIDEVGLIKRNKNHDHIRWAPDNSTLPHLEEINKAEQTVVIDFLGPVEENLKSWTLVTLHSKTYCGEGNYSACSFEHDGNKYMNVTFNVTLETFDFLKVTANGNQLKAGSMSGDIPNHMVFSYEYKYRPGEDQRLSCTYLGEESVKSQWFIPGIGLSREYKSNTISQNITLLEGDDGRTFICYFNNTKTDIGIEAIIKFKYVAASELLTMKINGKLLKKSTSRDNIEEVYDVLYKNNDIVNIICSPRNTKDKCNITLCIPPQNTTGVTTSTSCEQRYSSPISKNLTLGPEHHHALVTCTYDSDAFGNTRTSMGVRLVSIERQVVFQLKIHDELYANGSTYKYDVDNNQVPVECWSSIKFDGSRMDEMLSVSPQLILYHNKNKVAQEDLKKDSDIEMSARLNKAIQVNENDELQCVVVSKDKRDVFGEEHITVKEKEKTTTTSTTLAAPVTRETSPISTGVTDITDNREQSQVSSDQSEGIFSGMKSWYIYALIAVAVIVIFVLIIFIVKISRRKPRDTEELVPAEYETLNDTPPPPNFPQNATLEETYCKPADSKLSEPTYAQPYVPTLEELYSKPVPKNARKELVKDGLYASLEFENAYAKVKPKSERNKQIEEPGYAEVGRINDEPTYASVQQYANMKEGNREDYYNVFDNSSYANSKQNSEYVEPSYCEVSKVRK